jgi:phosphate transport system permease protein
MNITLHQTRKIINISAMSTAVVMMLFSLFWLGWILWTLFSNGFSALSLDILTQSTPPPGEAGGLANALLGSFLVTLFGTLIGTPIGILAGIYLAEFGQQGWLAPATRFINDILLSAPSIVVGLFVSVLYVQSMGHFSGWAGSIALSILVIPIVVRTTENMLRLVPNSLREAAIALGAPRRKVVTLVTLRAAKHGVLTGILLAVARISGETAPLLFTSFGNQFWSSNMNAPIATLPKVIFDFAMSPYEDWHKLAWAASLIIAFSVLALNIVARFLGRHSHNSVG